MKAVRIKSVDFDINTSRFEIVLLKDIIDQNLVFDLSINRALMNMKLHNGVFFSLRMNFDEFQFEKFKTRWERFQENDDYYFDLSEWSQ